jgi:O-antigen biosynthesis protein
MAIEEHGASRQLIRFRYWPRHSPFILALLALLGIGVAEAALNHVHIAFGALAISAGFVGFHVVRQCGAALAAIESAVRTFQPEKSAGAEDQQGLAPMRVQLGQMQ